MSKSIRKAVFPVGGMGTRFLPATKATYCGSSNIPAAQAEARLGTGSTNPPLAMSTVSAKPT